MWDTYTAFFVPHHAKHASVWPGEDAPALHPPAGGANTGLLGILHRCECADMLSPTRIITSHGVSTY
jgi:hypothetical protein